LQDPTVKSVLRQYEDDCDLFTESAKVASIESRNEAAFWQGRYGRFWMNRYYVFGKSTEFRYDTVPFFGFFHVRDTETIRRIKLEHGGDVPSVAECYLSLPQHFRDDGYRVIEGPFTSFYGVLPLDVTPLVFPHQLFAGQCAQSAAHTALLLMSERGARPLGLFDVSLLSTPVVDDGEALVDTEGGLLPDEVRRILKRPETGITGLLEVCKNYGAQVPMSVVQWEPADLETLLRDCVRNRLPLLLSVDFQTWKTSAQNCQSIEAASSEAGRHMVVLVGHREKTYHRESGFIFHDSHLGPWIEMDIAGVSAAAKQVDGESGIHRYIMVVAAPKHVDVPLSAAYDLACRHYIKLGCTECRPAHLKISLMNRKQFSHFVKKNARSSKAFETEFEQYYPAAELTHVWAVQHEADLTQNEANTRTSGPHRSFFISTKQPSAVAELYKGTFTTNRN